MDVTSTITTLRQMRAEYQQRIDALDIAINTLAPLAADLPAPDAVFQAPTQPKQTARKGRRKAEVWTDPEAGTYPSVQIDPDAIPDYNTSGRGGIRLDR